MTLSPSQIEALERIEAGAFYPDLVREEQAWYARWRPLTPCSHTVAGYLDEYVRAAAETPLTRHAENDPHETLHDAWIAALRSSTGLVRWNSTDCRAFARTLHDWHDGLTEAATVRKNIVFTFHADDSTLTCTEPHERNALKALGHAARLFGPLRTLTRRKPKAAGLLVAPLTPTEAEDLLVRGARLLTEAGYTMHGCDLKAAVTAAAELAAAPNAEAASSTLKLTIKVAGECVSAQDIRFLLEQHSTLVFFRNRWIEVDRNILKQALRALESIGAAPLPKARALAFALGIGHIGRLELETVAAHGWLRGLLHELRQAQATCDNKALAAQQGIPDFHGTLRDYQRRGVTWLTFLTSHGFGALLADDMGLGKTIQTIAWILQNREADKPVLIVAPLTLLANWQREFATFAPSLKIYMHQGPNRAVASGFIRSVRAADVVLTSYNLLVKDHLPFGEIPWAALVLDEAQAIKNPDTAIARAVRALTPPKRIALTGTPIENSVADVWSIEEFLNPGFLGERKDFTERFVQPLLRDPHAAAGKRLRHALEPFVLRRLKSEPGIAAELGPKRELREYCTLSPNGRADYEAALADWHATPRRRGDIFTLLTRLKLICDGSGKFDRLAELLDTIFANGESALIFTQYAKVGRELKTKLDARFGTSTPFLHGALTVRQREDTLAAFQQATQPSAFILSLRTGGFGLNLTKATHVIHYDRWWNPAVENQATDRAHRIGQTRTVFVHLMMTAGTIEDHVDEILSRKTAISGNLVTSGERFLSELPPELFEKAVALDE